MLQNAENIFITQKLAWSCPHHSMIKRILDTGSYECDTWYHKEPQIEHMYNIHTSREYGIRKYLNQPKNYQYVICSVQYNRSRYAVNGLICDALFDPLLLHSTRWKQIHSHRSWDGVTKSSLSPWQLPAKSHRYEMSVMWRQYSIANHFNVSYKTQNTGIDLLVAQ